MGHKIFFSTPQTLPVKFMAGDIFDKSFLEPGEITVSMPHNQSSADLPSLTTLTVLRGKLSAIHASLFFHLFSEEHQTELAHLLGCLLSPEPGSIIFGTHTGRPEKGVRVEHRGANQRVQIFSHSPESWNAMWETVFGPGKVEVSSFLRERSELRALTGGETNYLLVWWVKRL